MTITDIDADEAEAAAAAIRGEGRKAEARQQDVADEAAWDALIADVVAREGASSTSSSTMRAWAS